MAPAPVWKTNPSVKRLDAAITSTARLAISKSLGFFVTRAAPRSIYKGVVIKLVENDKVEEKVVVLKG